VVEKCAEAFGWRAVKSQQSTVNSQQSSVSGQQSAVGFGFACAFKNIGFSFGAPEGAWATVELRGGAEVEKAIVYHAGADVGQGAHTVMAQMAANALSISPDKVELVASDTATTGNSGSASASRMTWMSGNSIRGAAALALKKWAEEERPARATYHYEAPPTENYDPETGKSKPNLAYGYVAEAVEVEVDVETGQVRVIRVTCADDVGEAVNPKLIEGQIEGGIAQALGWTITENFVMQDGRVLTPYLSQYLVPGILDAPERVESVILEYPDENGPWGARGMGEMPFIPLAPAIVAAVHDATGVWFDELPLVPWRVVEMLKGER
jgi:CO/xanthine dehydrogenase Mo-binding subunit